MRGFRLSRPSDDGAPRPSTREEAEAEAAAELRRVLEGAGLPPEGATEVLERTAAHRAGGDKATAREPAPSASTAPEPAPDEPDAADVAARPPTRRVRKSPPGAAPGPADAGAASPRRASAPRTSRSERR